MYHMSFVALNLLLCEIVLSHFGVQTEFGSNSIQVFEVSLW